MWRSVRTGREERKCEEHFGRSKQNSIPPRSSTALFSRDNNNNNNFRTSGSKYEIRESRSNSRVLIIYCYYSSVGRNPKERVATDFTESSNDQSNQSRADAVRTFVPVPVRDEREYESDQGHAAAQDDDQGQHALLAGHRPSGHGRQIAHDGHSSRINVLHAGTTTIIPRGRKPIVDYSPFSVR